MNKKPLIIGGAILLGVVLLVRAGVVEKPMNGRESPRDEQRQQDRSFFTLL